MKKYMLFLILIVFSVVAAGCAVAEASADKIIYDLSETELVTTNASELEKVLFETPTGEILVHFGEEGISGEFVLCDAADETLKQSLSIDAAVDAPSTPNSSVIQKSFTELLPDKGYSISVEGVDPDTIVVVSCK